MDYVEFNVLAERFFLESKLDWVVQGVRLTVADGLPYIQKDVLPFKATSEIKSGESQASVFTESGNYLPFFEQKSGSKSVQTTRPFEPADISQLYFNALYSVLIEPAQLAKAGAKLLDKNVGEIEFISEKGDEIFKIDEVATDYNQSQDELRHLFEIELKSAP